MDLLTVLAHELGHVIGREHEDWHDDVMSPTLDAGPRLLPGIEESGVRSQESGVIDQFFSDSPLSSEIPHSAFRIPHSSFSPLDTVFANHDAGQMSFVEAFEEDEESDAERSNDEDGDELNLWLAIHGFDS